MSLEETLSLTPFVKSLDDFLRLSWYSLIILWLAEFLALSCLASMTFMMYAGANPIVTGCGNIAFNGSIICNHLKNMRELTGCVPKLEYQFRAVNVDFDRVCSDSHDVKNSISIQMIGVLIGAAVFGQASDLCGRRKVMLWTGTGMSFFCLLTAYSTSLTMFTILRTVTGFFTGGLIAIQGVFLIENIPHRHRLWVQTVVAWSPNFIIFPYIAYLSHDWATLAKVNAVIGVFGIVFCFIVYESPRWLVQKGRIKEAKEILEKISKIDGNNDDDFSLDLENWFLRERQLLAERTSKKRHYTFIHLFCTWKMMSWTITLVTGITTAALVTYALLYNMEKLSGSIFWNSAIFGIVRWIMNIIVALGDYYVPWFGRRAINQAAMLFNIFALGCMAFLYWKGVMEVGGWMLRTGTILAMSMCSQLFLAKYILANELYPTAVRNLAISAMSTSSRLGTIFAPQLFYLGDIALYLPYFVLLCLSMFDFIVFQCYIPETKGKRLENHLPPKEQRLFYKKKAESNPLVKA